MSSTEMNIRVEFEQYSRGDTIRFHLINMFLHLLGFRRGGSSSMRWTASQAYKRRTTWREIARELSRRAGERHARTSGGSDE